VVLVPEIAVSRWFNTPEPLTLSGLRGRPVLLHAFQMLCPGCVAHGTPQTQRAFNLFKHSDLQVIGLHTVFEHHAAGVAGSVHPRISADLSDWNR
jgi:peroxiredoxin